MGPRPLQEIDWLWHGYMITAWLWDVINNPCPKFNGGLAIPPLKLGYGWVIIPYCFLWMYVHIYTLHSVAILIISGACHIPRELGQYLGCVWSGPWFNIKMLSYQYRKSHCGDKTVVRSSYLHNGISYTGKTTSLYWIGAQALSASPADMRPRFDVIMTLLLRHLSTGYASSTAIVFTSVVNRKSQGFDCGKEEYEDTWQN